MVRLNSNIKKIQGVEIRHFESFLLSHGSIKG